MNSKVKVGPYCLFILVLVIFIASSGCTPEYRHKVLTFIFDGVPDLDTVLVLNDSLIQDTVTQILYEKAVKPKVYSHEPYAQKLCFKCHLQGTFGKLVVEEPELCYQCHSDFNEKFKKLHGPVSGGYCSACHTAHQTKNEHLLTRVGNEICLDCHDVELMLSNDFHNLNDELFCTNCHNPHGGDNSVMPQPGLCYTCHDDYTEKYKFVHGPVIGQYCTACHGPHSTPADYKLLLQGQQICLKCHSENMIFSLESHKDIGETNCLDCHNPHGGDDRFIFN